MKTEKKPAKPAAKKPAKRAAAEGDAKPKRAKKPRVKAEPGPRTLALPPAAATIGFASGAPRATVRTGEVRVGSPARHGLPAPHREVRAPRAQRHGLPVELRGVRRDDDAVDGRRRAL